MKFSAIMKETHYVREFQSVVLMLSKLCKECVVKISANSMHFVANEESGTTAPLVWLDINAHLYFTKFAMEGVDEAHPQILLSVSPLNLVRALGAQRYTLENFSMKLTNIQFPCLSIDTELKIQDTERMRLITHDVPVRVIPRRDWACYAVPQVPPENLVLQMPSNRLMRSLVDKMKNLTSRLIFYATSNGELNIVAETDMTTITTRYRKLDVRALNLPVETGTRKSMEASCAVDCKKTAIFFTAIQTAAFDLSCGIVDDKLIHMMVNVHEGIVIHSILPALCL